MVHSLPALTHLGPLHPPELSGPPRCDPREFPVSDALRERIIGWDTRELYEPAEELIDTWEHALEKVAAEIYEELPMTRSAS